MVVFAALAIKFYLDKVAAEAAYDQLIEEQKAFDISAASYQTKYNLLVGAMISDAANAENCGNMIKSVWGNSILEKKDPETDRYTMKDGKFVSDFNDALGALFDDDEFKSDIMELDNG